jgi:hypothetical protein
VSARRRVVLAALLCAGAAPAAAGDPAPFHALLLPPLTVTGVDSTVSVTFEVDPTATHFNAYEVTIEFDPAIAAFEAVAEGALMTAACTNTFDTWSQTGSTVTYSHSLLCAGVSVDGPGILSTFRFRAVGEGVTELRITSPDTCTFVDAGVCVSPLHPSRPRQVTLTGAYLSVGGDPTAAVPGTTARPPAELRIVPNPVRATALFRVRLPAPGPAVLEVLDPAGRRVLRRDWTARGGVESIPWSAPGVAAGVYHVRLTGGGSAATARIVLVR